MEHVVLCPGSRSGPLALALGALSKINDFQFITTIDERSAAFLALGISTATGKATAVITTSGTAVANLLPAAVEADRSSQPILFLTADRPMRLKNCGSNQTVNQEDFLCSVCRSCEQGPADGVHLLTNESLEVLVERSWQTAHCFPGPVHINLPIEEPLTPTLLEQENIYKDLRSNSKQETSNFNFSLNISNNQESGSIPHLDQSLPGVVVVGPWRGNSQTLPIFQEILKTWQLISGWPVFADPLSGVSINQPGLIGNWELLLDSDSSTSVEDMQVLRLGPMPASRILEKWLQRLDGKQLLITEGDFRRLDPLKLSTQWSGGLVEWWRRMVNEGFVNKAFKKVESSKLLKSLIKKDQMVQDWLDLYLPFQGLISEPALARWLPRILPSDMPIMLSASSPVRDWLSYAGKEALNRRCFGFRGASGIDGTLSLGMGLAMAKGPVLLVTGDLALLHDCNGWLFSSSEGPPLVVLVIDNGGGGIFNRVNLQTESKESFEKLFAMPQSVDILSLVNSYGVPYRQVACLEDLPGSLEWSFSKSGPVLIRVCTNPDLDAHTRKEISMLLDQYLQGSFKNLF